MTDEPIIGVYIGEINSFIGFWEEDKIELIKHGYDDKKSIPSYVSFESEYKYVGENAKYYSINTIYNIINIIGRRYDDPILQKYKKSLPFEIEKDVNSDKIKIIVEYLNEIKSFYAEEIIAMIIKELIKGYNNIKNVVITIPNNFNILQRKAIIDSCKLVKLNVLKLINESTATAIYYQFNNYFDEKEKYLICSFNENKMEISNYENNQVCLTEFYDDIKNLDNLLLDYCINQFRQNTGIDISNNQKVLFRIKRQFEPRNWEGYKLRFNIDNLINGEDLDVEINISEIEEMIRDLFKNINNINNLNQIDKIIFTGNITQISNMIKDIFDDMTNIFLDKKTIYFSEEIYVYGAVIQSAIINNIKNKKLDKIHISNVTSSSIGIDKGDNIINIIFPKNSIIPCEKVNNFSINNKDSFKIYEGEKK